MDFEVRAGSYIDCEPVSRVIGGRKLMPLSQTPTVEFSRSQVFRTPDVLSDSLTINYAMLLHICSTLRPSNEDISLEHLPEDYIPSASSWSSPSVSR